MKNIKEFAEDTMEFVTPKVKNAGEYVCVVSKSVKEGFLNGKNKVTGFLSNKENRNRVFEIALIILMVLTAVVAVFEICNLASAMKERKRNKIS